MSKMYNRRIRMTVVPSRKLYLVLTAEGLDFVEKWFNSNKHIPSDLTKLYQLLLYITRFNGVLNLWVALRLGYGRHIINRTVSNAYLELSSRPRKPSDEVLSRIKEMYGKPPEEIYA